MSSWRMFKRNFVFFVTLSGLLFFVQFYKFNMAYYKFFKEISGMDYCPDVPPNLVGQIQVITSPIPQIIDLESDYDWLQHGGHHKPFCRQNQTVAIIVPYRNRPQQLLLFLKHMHPFLRKQQLHYTIFVIEQSRRLPFNRAMLFNVGFLESFKHHNYTCFIFHDVDLLPENDRNMYKCHNVARHMISSLDKWNYSLVTSTTFGGVVAMSKQLFEELNGFSNRYWGWGGEDDDFYLRLTYHNHTRIRYPKDIGRYKMIKHIPEKPNPGRFNILQNATAYYMTDGLTNVNYTIRGLKKYLLYTNILVDLHKTTQFR